MMMIGPDLWDEIFPKFLCNAAKMEHSKIKQRYFANSIIWLTHIFSDQLWHGWWQMCTILVVVVFHWFRTATLDTLHHQHQQSNIVLHLQNCQNIWEILVLDRVYDCSVSTAGRCNNNNTLMIEQPITRDCKTKGDFLSLFSKKFASWS